MRYYLLVSHGVFAPGLHSAVSMMAGSGRTDIRSTSLEDGMDVPTYRAAFEKLVADITADDEILLFGDIIGRKPFAFQPIGKTKFAPQRVDALHNNEQDDSAKSAQLS